MEPILFRYTKLLSTFCYIVDTECITLKKYPDIVSYSAGAWLFLSSACACSRIFMLNFIASSVGNSRSILSSSVWNSLNLYSCCVLRESTNCDTEEASDINVLSIIGTSLREPVVCLLLDGLLETVNVACSALVRGVVC